MTSRRRHVPAAQQQQEGEGSCVSRICSEPLEHTSLLKKVKRSSCWRDSSSTNEVSDNGSSTSFADNSSNSRSQSISSSAVSSKNSTVRYVQRSSSRSSSRKTRASGSTDSSSSRCDPSTRRNSSTRGATTGRSNICTKQSSSTSSYCCSSFESEEDVGGGSTYSPAAAFGKLLRSQQLKRWVHYLILLLRCSYSSFTATPAASALTASRRRKHFLPFGECRFTWPATYRVACCSMFLLLGASCAVAIMYWCVSLYTLSRTLASFDFPVSSSGTPPFSQSVSLSAHVDSSSPISSSFSPSYQPRAAATSRGAGAAGSTSVTHFISTVKAKSATRAEEQRERRKEGFFHVLQKQQHAQLPQNLLLLLQQPSLLGQSTQPQQQAQYMEQRRQSVESQKSSQPRQQSTVEQPLQLDDQNALNHRDVLQYIWQHDSGGPRGRQQQQYVVGAASRRQLARTIQVGPPDTYTGFSASSLWEAFKVAPQEYLLALLFLVTLVLFGFFCSWLCGQRSFQKAVLVSP